MTLWRRVLPARVWVQVDVTSEHPEGDVLSMWLDLYRVTLGEKPRWSQHDTTVYPWICYSFFIVFSMLSSVVLVRLLISMVCRDTYTHTHTDSLAARTRKKGWELIGWED